MNRQNQNYLLAHLFMPLALLGVIGAASVGAGSIILGIIAVVICGGFIFSLFTATISLVVTILLGLAFIFMSIFFLPLLAIAAPVLLAVFLVKLICGY